MPGLTPFHISVYHWKGPTVGAGLPCLHQSCLETSSQTHLEVCLLTDSKPPSSWEPRPTSQGGKLMGHACGKQPDWLCCSQFSLSSAGLIMIAASGNVLTVILNEEQQEGREQGGHVYVKRAHGDFCHYCKLPKKLMRMRSFRGIPKNAVSWPL